MIATIATVHLDKQDINRSKTPLKQPQVSDLSDLSVSPAGFCLAQRLNDPSLGDIVEHLDRWQ